MTTTVFGLTSCDACRKALKELEAANIVPRFVDVRVAGVSERQVASWAKEIGWETLLNRRGTTWRALGDGDKADMDEAKAVRLMAAHPALIKRPVVEHDGALSIGLPAESGTG